MNNTNAKHTQHKNTHTQGQAGRQTDRQTQRLTLASSEYGDDNEDDEDESVAKNLHFFPSNIQNK